MLKPAAVAGALSLSLFACADHATHPRPDAATGQQAASPFDGGARPVAATPEVLDGGAVRDAWVVGPDAQHDGALSFPESLDGSAAPDAASPDAGTAPVQRAAIIDLQSSLGGVCAVSAEHAFYCTSTNGYVQLSYTDQYTGYWTDWERVTSGDWPMGLRNGGQLWEWGVYGPTRVGTWSGVRDVSGGAGGHCAVLADRSLQCWGTGQYGELGHPLAQLARRDQFGEQVPCTDAPLRVGTANDWEEISMAGPVSCGRRGGDVYCWGSSIWFPAHYTQVGDRPPEATDGEPCSSAADKRPCYPTPRPAFTAYHDWVELAVANDHVCARRANGEVHCHGLYNDYGELGASAPIADLRFDAIGAATARTCGLAQGKLYCWGRDLNGELGDGAAQRQDGCLFKPCSAVPVELPAPPGSTWTKLSKSGGCALTSTGRAYCWGTEAYYAVCGSPQLEAVTACIASPSELVFPPPCSAMNDADHPHCP